VNRRVSAVALSLVAAMVVSSCGGGESSSRTRNDALISNTGGDLVLNCYATDDERARAREEATTFWSNRLEELRQQLAREEAVEVIPALDVSGGIPREEFADEASYVEAVTEAQEAFTRDKELEDAQRASKEQAVAALRATIEQAERDRDEALARIDDAPACVGDPDTGLESGPQTDPLGLAPPCVTAAAADLVGSVGSQTLRIRVCDAATKVSLQNYDISYNSLGGSEQQLSEGTGRFIAVDITTNQTTYKAVSCSTSGYIDSSIITVDGQNVSTERLDESDQPIVVDFCGGTSQPLTDPSGGDGGTPTGGGDNTNQLPVADDGGLDNEAIYALGQQCGQDVSFDVKEVLDVDNTYTANEELLGVASLACAITTPQLRRVETYIKATNLGNEEPGKVFHNGEDTTSTSGEVTFVLDEGTWAVKAVFRLVFEPSEGVFTVVDVPSVEKELVVGPFFDDPNICRPKLFTLSAAVDGVKTLSAKCDYVKYGLIAVTSKFDESMSPDAEYIIQKFPAQHKVGAKVLVHDVSGGRGYIGYSQQLLSCDDECQSDTTDDNVTLTRTEDSVELKAKDRCASKGEGYDTMVVASPFLALQPDLLLRQQNDDEARLFYSSTGAGFRELSNKLSVKSSSPWWWVGSMCIINGKWPADATQAIDPQQWLVKLSDVPSPGDDEPAADTTSTPVIAPPATPIASVVKDGALVATSAATSVAVSPSAVAALLEELNVESAVVAVSFDNGAFIPLSRLTPQRLSVPTDAKVFKIAVAKAGSEPTVTEYPVQRIEPVDAVTGVVADETTSGSNTWIYVVIAVVLLLLLLVIARRRRKVSDDEASVN